MLTAIVKPLIKKPSLDEEDVKNYRPVSNLAFLGNVIDGKCVYLVLLDFIAAFDTIDYTVFLSRF